MAAYLVETKDEKRARKKHELGQRLNDPRKIIASLRYYDAHLVPQKRTVLRPPRRERSRKPNPGWPDALKAAKRILGIVVRRVKDEQGRPVRDKRGRLVLEYYLRQDAWAIMQSRLAFRQDQLLGTSEPERLYLSEEAADAIRRSQIERAAGFHDKLFDPRLWYNFKHLPAGFRMTAQLEELASELGPPFLDSVRAWLSEDYYQLAARLPQRVRALEESRSEHLACAQAEPTRPEIFQRQPTQNEVNEVYTQGIKTAVRGHLNKIRDKIRAESE
jgi:hypothetical protein